MCQTHHPPVYGDGVMMGGNVKAEVLLTGDATTMLRPKRRGVRI